MSSGSEASEASSTMKAKGVHCQVWIAITETMASVGSPSQFLLPRPALMARKSTMPNSGASMKVRQIMPTTAGDSTTGRMAMTLNQPWPRFMSMTSKASANPMMTCSATVEPV